MRLSPHRIEPVTKTRSVGLSPSDAFELFTAKLETWWPLGSHSIAEADAVGVRFEGWVGGRVVELTADGSEHSWADILAWDPPHRFAMAWHPSVDPEVATIVDVRFIEIPDGTRLELEHRAWEEFGADKGQTLRNDYAQGWEPVLDGFTAIAG